MTLVCPHRRYHREATHYRCLGDGETECTHTLPLGEAETEPVEGMKFTRLERLSLQPVHGFMPEKLHHGVLYWSHEFQLAIHLCACGCGEQTVTPLGLNGWTLFVQDNPTLTPSIGNFQMPCRSHYFVTDGRIVWC